ncbi:MAG: 2-oxoacid:acceptor oxidoreductase family protein [Longimicrobiales bacterium]|nr:2-oxoacid:acceptor oxidoreductase family protein [Longimicrobiales bacterium]
MSEKDDGTTSAARFPGLPMATDGTGAVVHAETHASEAAGAYPITPSTQMGEGWADAVAKGKTNVFGRRLRFFEPEGEHAAAAVTAGMSMSGLRATNFSSGQGIAYMHESLYAATGKRLTYVLNVAARAMTKHALNVHAGHDDYHAVDDTGFFQLFAKNVQEAGDFALIAHRVAELALTPGLNAQDGFLTSHVLESVRLPEPELIREYLGDPADDIDCPTPAQRLSFGPRRRRIPELFSVDYPAMLGTVQNQDAYAQGVAAQRPFYFDHVAALTDRAMEEWAERTGRRYARASGHRMDDAEWVLVGQGSVVPNLELVADHLRRERGLKVGVLNVTMFRPFPADLVTRLLSGRKAVTVFERCDQPLAVDAPLLREIRAAMTKGMENARARAGAESRGWLGGHRRRRAEERAQEDRAAGDGGRRLPFPGLAELGAEDVPDFHSAGFGFGSRDLQAGDIVAAVENMLPEGEGRRQFYLGIDFIRKETRLPKLRIWQERLLEEYPELETLALSSAGELNLLPEGSTAIRIHSVGGWGAITMGKNLTMTAFELFGMHVKANPKYGSEKKGQPTTFYSVLAHEPIKLNAELKHVNVALSPDGNVFAHSDPLAGMEEGGVFVIQSHDEPEKVWASIPADARSAIRERGIRVYALDAFGIASSEASDPELRYRMQGAAFMGAFFRCAPLVAREGMDEERLFQGIRAQTERKFGHRGEQVVEDNLRVIRRGWEEVVEIPTDADVREAEASEAPVAPIPSMLSAPDAEEGLANPGRFYEQVCSVCAIGQDTIADPYAAVSAMPAASSSIRDMTGIRFEVPDFVAERCTGCSQCWIQCPDAAIPGLVTSVEDLYETAVRHAANGRPLDHVSRVTKHLARESRKILKGVPFHTFGEVASTAFANVVDKLGWDPDRRARLEQEWSRVYPVLDEFPLAKTVPFFDLPESKEKGTGGLLSITVNPEACKGCNICVEVCPEEALVTVKQDEEIVDRLRRNWTLWERLPDTEDRYLNIRDLDEGIGVLSSLLLKKDNYRSMAGGDGACMGCGEKTAVHLVVSTIEALMQPRVDAFVHEVDRLSDELDGMAREIVASEADLDEVAVQPGDHADVDLSEEKKTELRRITRAKKELDDLVWLYTQGPSGKGRVSLGISNSTGCSSVWGSTYPYNPYPFPWVNHLFQDAPSIALGIFEGHMRKMGDAFLAVRRARAIVDGSYRQDEFEPFAEAFDWKQFTDDEFKLCPPILTIGGDGAMLDIGFQNLSRLMASGKPLTVMVLDTQVYSNTGGQACTSGFTGQVADMSAWGKAQHGKTEVRKELAFIAMAHRGVFVHQSSQASASHLVGGVIKALGSRRPAVLNVYTPCPVEHGLADEWAPRAAKLALESRAFPFLTYDPDAGPDLSDCLSLVGNPDIQEIWPSYTLEYVDDDGEPATMELPVTTADWAATEVRFRKNFEKVPPEDWNDDMLPFHEFMALDGGDRQGKRPFIWTLDDEKRLERLQVSTQMVTLAEDRLSFWHQLREIAGLDVPEAVHGAVEAELEAELDARLDALKTEYEAKLAELRATYPRIVARRMAEGLLAHRGGDVTVSELLQEAERAPGLEPIGPLSEGWSGSNGSGGTAGGTPGQAGEVAVAEPPNAEGASGAGATGGPVEEGGATEVQDAPAPSNGEADGAEGDEEDEAFLTEPWIETARCTSCNECTNLNGRMFAYDENKQAYIKDPLAGTFAELVQAAELCPAGIIHPGDPLNPKEKDLEKWIARAEPFN